VQHDEESKFVGGGWNWGPSLLLCSVQLALAWNNVKVNLKVDVDES
jgi:hypothetical protein